MKDLISIFIPARMDSNRFPGKPLAPIKGIPMVVYCARNAILTGYKTYVCTDSKEIKCVCDIYDVNCIMTGKCNTGTDRIAVAAKDIATDYIINLQGDEPLIDSVAIKKTIDDMRLHIKDNNDIVNAITPVGSDLAFDPNNVKCAINQKNNKILYFSRKPLLNNTEDKNTKPYFKILGLYGMSKETLNIFSSMSQSNLEKSEKIEQLRWIENGLNFYASILETDAISVDSPNDLVDVLNKLSLSKD